MLIKGKLDTYKCSWQEWGWSFARPVVRKRKKYPIIGDMWVKVWENTPCVKYYSDVELYTPDEMGTWFTECVEQYEAYTIAWGDVEES